MVRISLLLALIPLLGGCVERYVRHGSDLPARYDLLILGATIYDGRGKDPYVADIAIEDDRIAAIGRLRRARAREVIDARGLAAAPGFINMLSWSTISLIEDGRSLGELVQGVTTQILGEGFSMGPLSETMRKDLQEHQGLLKYEVAWSSLREYLEHLESRGVSQNVASFVGHTTLRRYAIGLDDRPPSPGELELMRILLEREMRDGAVGLSTALIYPPASFAATEEILELAKVAAKYDGLYITHLRSEGNSLVKAVEEFLHICEKAGIAGQIYHLKAAGETNFDKLDTIIEMVEKARARGQEITADVYPYTAGATGLTASVPTWAQDGGHDAMVARFRDPELRARILEDMGTPSLEWENLYLAAGKAENVLLVGFANEELREKYQGKTLEEVATSRGTSPLETILDLITEDDTRVEAVYFFMHEDNVKKKIALPWVSFCSDAASMAPEGAFLELHPHPRAYGSFARVLGRYARDEKVISLTEAVRKLTSLPARVLGLDRRGLLEEGYFADIVLFDPEKIQDHATYLEPHQLATGVRDVIVNGRPALREGRFTGEFPGRALKRRDRGSRIR